jgi:hypothetical protein
LREAGALGLRIDSGEISQRLRYDLQCFRCYCAEISQRLREAVALGLRIDSGAISQRLRNDLL